jgi:UDP-2-acetamido-3-amino-2,3-dideoxy-glucuronate N-acetyltransferase
MVGMSAGTQESYYAHPSAVIDAGCSIGKGTKIWHFSHVSSNSTIGEHCTLGQNVFVAPRVAIGNHCKIQNNVSLYEGVELKDYVFCGPSMVFTNVVNPRCKYPQRGSGFYQSTIVNEGASMGANCTIVCGVTIGKHAFVGAGAVVTRDVPDYALVVGVPARRIGWVCECGANLTHSQSITPTERFACPRCERSYRVLNETSDGERLVEI